MCFEGKKNLSSLLEKNKKQKNNILRSRFQHSRPKAHGQSGRRKPSPCASASASAPPPSTAPCPRRRRDITSTGSGEWRSGRWRSWVPARRAAAGTTAAAASQPEPSTVPFPFTTPMCPPPPSGRSASLPRLYAKP
jgi:hypothetical protein